MHGVRMSLLQMLTWHLCGNVLSTHFAMYAALHFNSLYQSPQTLLLNNKLVLLWLSCSVTLSLEFSLQPLRCSSTNISTCAAASGSSYSDVSVPTMSVSMIGSTGCYSHCHWPLVLSVKTWM